MSTAMKINNVTPLASAVSPTLFDSVLNGGAEKQFGDIMNELIVEASNGARDQYFFNVDYYLSKAPEAYEYFTKAMIAQIGKFSMQFNWRTSENIVDMLNGVEKMYLATGGVLERFVCVGIDLSKEGYPTSLVTRDMNTLKELDRKGYLVSRGLDVLEEALKGTKLKKSIEDRKHVVVRLDHDGFKNGHPVFKAVIPRSTLDIGSNKQFFIIPVPFMYAFQRMVFTRFNQSPIKLVKESVIGAVTKHVATSLQVVKGVYENASALESRLTKASRVEVGYDILKQRFFLHDLEASASSLGVASFRPEMLNYIGVAEKGALNTQLHDIDMELLRAIFVTRVNGAKAGQLEELNLLDLSSYATQKDKAEAFIITAEKMGDDALYFHMVRNSGFYGDIHDALEKRARLIPKFIKQLKQVELPPHANNTQKAKILQDALSKGVVKFIVKSKSGSLMERVGTTNPKVLERMIGKDYVKVYESPKERLTRVGALIQNGKLTDRAQLERAGSDYNILDLVDNEKYFDTNREIQVESIVEALQVLKDKASARKVKEGTVTYKNIKPKDEKSLYGNINVENLVAVEVSELE